MRLAWILKSIQNESNWRRNKTKKRLAENKVLADKLKLAKAKANAIAKTKAANRSATRLGKVSSSAPGKILSAISYPSYKPGHIKVTKPVTPKWAAKNLTLAQNKNLRMKKKLLNTTKKPDPKLLSKKLASLETKNKQLMHAVQLAQAKRRLALKNKGRKNKTAESSFEKIKRQVEAAQAKRRQLALVQRNKKAGINFVPGNKVEKRNADLMREIAEYQAKRRQEIANKKKADNTNPLLAKVEKDPVKMKRNEALRDAVVLGNTKEVTQLLKAGADPNFITRAGKHSLLLFFAAATKHSAPIAKALIKGGVNVNQLAPDGRNAIFVHIKTNRIASVIVLIKAKIDLTVRAKDGVTPAYIAAKKNRSVVLHLLIKAGASLDIAHEDGTSPLMIASLYGHHEIVSMLIQQGVDTRLRDRKGLTASHYAKVSGNQKIIVMLTTKKVDGHGVFPW